MKKLCTRGKSMFSLVAWKGLSWGAEPNLVKMRDYSIVVRGKKGPPGRECKSNVGEGHGVGTLPTRQEFICEG